MPLVFGKEEWDVEGHIGMADEDVLFRTADVEDLYFPGIGLPHIVSLF
jgi:hypothetical protein